MGKRLVLLGAGHAHLHVLQRARQVTCLGHSVTIVAPDRFWYSGCATGMLGAEYGPDRAQLDITRLAAAWGCSLVAGEVTGLDPAARQVRLRHGPSLPYDVLSVALGSEVPILPGDGGPACFPAKPISELWALRQHVERHAGAAPRILVAGGGMTACEVAANLSGLCRRAGLDAAITLVAPPGGLLARIPPGAARTILHVLRQGGVTVRQDGPVLAAGDGRADLPGGATPFDVLVNATGLQPCSALRGFGLPLRDGGLLVDAFLRSVADPAVHGAGDCIAFGGAALPHAGVFAVRQGPVLLHNLRAALEGTPPVAFTPQRRYLWIMNLGDGTGLATYGTLHARGRLALALKHRIDRRFLDQYRVPCPC